jgi:peptidoglycan/xylan/chitin deacetylase (PgdA/CDA1 family)
MKRIVVFSIVLAGTLGACKSRSFNSDGETKEIQAKNIFGSGLGIGKGTIALTFDDGPGPRTLELAQYLAENDVPAAFFVQGSSAVARASSLATIAGIKLKSSGQRAFVVANHTFTHCDVSDEKNDASGEVARTHNEVKKYTVGKALFFRPPYGAAMNYADRCAINNDSTLRSYVGPIFWDIGGALANGYAADWACWSKGLSVQDCANRYLAEAVARNGGIVLAHDIHGRTVEMMKILVPALKAKGFKFVGLDANPEKVASFGGRATAEAYPTLSVSAHQVDTDVSGRTMSFKVDCERCSKVELWVNGLSTPLYTEAVNPESFEYERQFVGEGSRIMTVKGFDTAGLQMRQADLAFLVGVPKTSELTCTVSASDGKANARVSANGNILGQLASGDKVVAIGAMQEGWYNVRLPRPVGGASMAWMHKSMLSCSGN